MKPTSPSIPDPETPAPNAIDDIIDDLAQQDYMPSHQGSIEPPEEPIETGSWDEPVGEHGHRNHTEIPTDEASFPEQLVSDGLDEADQELRELDEQEEAPDEDNDDQPP